MTMSMFVTDPVQRLSLPR